MKASILGIQMEDLIKTYAAVVAYFGGQVETAEALEVKQPSVSAWVNGKAVMSIKVAQRAEMETAGVFKAENLSPHHINFQMKKPHQVTDGV